MSRPTCVVYANCQGAGIRTFLEQSAGYRATFETAFVENFSHIRDGTPPDADVFRCASVFVHQPLAPRLGVHSTEQVLALLTPGCEIISFPYVYNDALWPLFPEHDGIVGADAVVRLREQGLSCRQIVDRFCRLEIDFDFERRFERTTAILAEREARTDVKVLDFILSRLRHERVFLTQNHPTSAVFVFCANQILRRLGCDPVPSTRSYPPDFANLSGQWPVTPYDSRHYRYAFTESDPGWRAFYLGLLGSLCLPGADQPVRRSLQHAYLRLRSRGA